MSSSGAEETSPLTESCDLAFDMMQGQGSMSDPPSRPEPAQERMLFWWMMMRGSEGPRSLLEGWGYTVHDFSKTEDTLIKVDFLCRDGFRPTVLVDLIMPRMDGSRDSGRLGTRSNSSMTISPTCRLSFSPIITPVTRSRRCGKRGTRFCSSLAGRKSSDRRPSGHFSEKLRSEMSGG